MNCTHIKRLIPLYVGGDLNTEEVAGVRKHIETCERCRGLVAEFEESQGWLRDFTAPQFDETVFKNLRDAVREEIARVESRPSLFDLLMPVWNIRSVIAASLALALLTAGLLLYTNRSKSPDKPLTTNKGGGFVPKGVPEQKHRDATDTGEQQHSRRQKLAASHRARRSPAHRVDNMKDETKLPVLGVIALNNHSIARHLGIQEISLPSQSDIAIDRNMDREMLRIEMQTADPNIRIIWFVPKDDTSPNFSH
jgi:putative zinc finger protein